MAGKRTYNSSLRAQQAEETRERILEAAVKLLGEGAHRLTVPNVAREAGVAVPTVYRHFASKEDLEDGVADHVRRMVRNQVVFDGVDGMVERVRANFAEFQQLPPGALPVLLASVGRNLRRSPAERLDIVGRNLADDLEGLSEHDRERVVLLAATLGSSPGAAAMMRLGLDPDQAADLVAWVLYGMIEQARGR